MTDTISVLHIDDEPSFSDMVATFLEREDDRITVQTAISPEKGLDVLANSSLDCIVSDYEMPQLNGLEVLNEVRETRPDLPFILYTGKGSEEIASEAVSAGVTDYLQKDSGTSQYTVLAHRIVNAVEQYHAQRELDESRERLSLFFEQSPLGVVEFNEQFHFQRVNEAAREILGRSEENLVGESWETIVPESDRDDVETIITEIQNTSGGYHNINKNVTGDGEHIVCEWYNRVVTDDDGDPVAVFSQFQEITEEYRRQTRQQRQREALVELATDDAVATGAFETAVQRITETAANVLDVQRINVWIQDETRDVVRCVDHYDQQSEIHDSGMELAVDEYPHYFDALRSEWALAVEDTATDPRTTDLTDDYLATNNIDALLDATLRSEGELIGMVCHEHVDGPRDWTEDEIQFAGNIADLVHRARRNKERREREHELEEERLFIEQALDTLNDVFYVVGVDGTFRRWNTRLSEVTGYPDHELATMEAVDLFPADDKEQISAAIEETFETGLAAVEAEFLTADGERIPYEFTGARLTDPDGNTSGLVGVGRDITRQKANERQLERQNERLEQFASVVSHDLQNPMNVAKGRLELAQDEYESQHLDQVDDALARMQRLIEDVLWLTSEGQDIGRTVPVDLQEAVDAAWDMTADNHEEADLIFDGSNSADWSRIRADDDRLQQVLENLFQNAIEHAGPDVLIRVKKTERGFAVEDDGPGIPPEERHRIFEASYSTSESGTGFGLQIVEQVVEAHEWDIHVIDGSLGGARFELTGIELVD
jgi:PAS domain S-box-containing protein